MKLVKRSIISGVLIILILSVFISSVNSQLTDIENEKKEVLVKDDILLEVDFEEYPTNVRVHNRRTAFTVYDGIGELWVNGAHPFSYHNSNIDTYEIFKYNNMTLKARVCDWLGGELNSARGSIGWGFSNSYINKPDYSFVWFIYQEGPRFYPWNGLWVWSRNDCKLTAKKIDGVKIHEFHEYGVDWTPDSYDFYVDGELVAQITENIIQENMSIEIWNDNAIWYSPNRNWGRIPVFGWGLIPRFLKVYGPKLLSMDYLRISE